MNRRFAVFTLFISFCLTFGITNSHSLENKAKEAKAPCRLEVEFAHISTSIFEKSKQMAVKVNAFSICNLPSSSVQITVELWKTGKLLPIKVAQSIANSRGVVPAGKKFSNKDTKARCRDRTPTYYYGLAYAKALIAGKWQYAGKTLSNKPTLLMCGT